MITSKKYQELVNQSIEELEILEDERNIDFGIFLAARNQCIKNHEPSNYVITSDYEYMVHGFDRFMRVIKRYTTSWKDIIVEKVVLKDKNDRANTVYITLFVVNDLSDEDKIIIDSCREAIISDSEVIESHIVFKDGHIVTEEKGDNNDN